jgi:hypothetical protein
MAQREWVVKSELIHIRLFNWYNNRVEIFAIVVHPKRDVLPHYGPRGSASYVPGRRRIEVNNVRVPRWSSALG